MDAATNEMCIKKRLYVTKTEAVQSVARHLKKYGAMMRAYKCPVCKAYHLTSRPDGWVVWGSEANKDVSLNIED